VQTSRNSVSDGLLFRQRSGKPKTGDGPGAQPGTNSKFDNSQVNGPQPKAFGRGLTGCGLTGCGLTRVRHDGGAL
jgi:hypothetical protein